MKDKSEKVTLDQLVEAVLDLAKRKGFGVKPEEVNTLEKIALIHSELSEALDAYRKKNIVGKDGFAEELADAVIRILHLAGVNKIDIQKEILKKLETNQGRVWDWDKINETHA